MLRERYPVDKLFEEIAAHFPEMDPILAKIDAQMEDDELYQLIRADLAKRRPKSLETGRNSTPVEVVLRMLVIKRLYQYSYAETERYVSDSLVLRQFCRMYLNRVPDDTTLIRLSNLIQPETLEKFNARITELALKSKVTKGKKLRTDGTVVETNIHAPSDSRQLADSVRVLARTMGKARKVLQAVKNNVVDTVEDFTMAARRTARKIGEILRKRTDEAKEAGKEQYLALLAMTEKTIQQAAQTSEDLEQQAGKAAQRLKRTLATFIPLAEKVVVQTRRRILNNENVPAQEKVLSIFESHTDIICRGKENRPVEYGHKVWLNEVDGGIVTHYRILNGNPNDETQWEPSLKAHVKSFGKPPEQASADRGLYSASNEKFAKDLGVQHVVLPKRGYKSKTRREHESQEWFVEGRKWHAGVEGRISVLKRAHSLGRCLNHGLPGFERWIGWGVIAGNLAVMGRA
jgi:transposase, IS5 family